MMIKEPVTAMQLTTDDISVVSVLLCCCGIEIIESNASKEKIVFESNIRIIIKNLGLRQDKQSDCMKMYLFCEAARGEGAARRRY